ncbi:DUF3667 domain-containing protein [Pedobacter gandavensis]|uniref:DUF3667 domain-containing protein n=1 Tax=Pedobacter gandavensis TaxID=2679963 RepID=UPI00292E2F96|nr:DUF3667 domain-containing protein [Pedobacter gandavensis]
MSGKYRKEKDCLNCGHQVEAHFCSYCGQENIIVKEDALHMVVHAVSDYFHFESKFFGTIKPLLFQPGVLTQKYVEGKRATYLHPIKLYIFISIVFFLVALSGNDKKEKVEKKATTAAHSTETNPSLNIGNVGIIGSIKKKAEEAKRINDSSEKKGGALQWNMSSDSTIEAYQKRQVSLAKKDRDGYFTRYFIKKSIKINRSKEGGEKLEEGLLHNIPKLMFLLLPLFALLLKLVYFNKKKYYFEHLIYSFHVHSAIFLVVLISTLITWVVGFVYDISQVTFVLCFFYITWYIYQSLRTFYGDRIWVTILKYFLLITCYTIVMTFTILLGLSVLSAMM